MEKALAEMSIEWLVGMQDETVMEKVLVVELPRQLLGQQLAAAL